MGATVGVAVFGKKLGRGAGVVGAVCGILPDLDIISGVGGPWASMLHHRGLTHSILFAVVSAPLLGWAAWRLYGRKDSKWTWTQLAFLAVVTHPLLDICTSYGTQLLWPFSNARLAIDAIPIVDPLYTLTLVAALVAARWWRDEPARGQLAAIGALAVTTAYLAFGYAQSQRAQRMATEQLRAQGFEPVHMRAQPAMLVWMWRIVARDDAGNLRVGVVSTYRPTPMSFEALERPDSPLVDQALRSERGEQFRWFADGMVGARVEQHESLTRVYLDDLRYGLVTEPTRAFWGARADFDDGGKLMAMDRYRRSR